MHVEIVLNREHGHFALSRAAILRLRELGHAGALQERLVGERDTDGTFCDDPHREDQYGIHFDRLDPQLVAVVRELGPAANGRGANLRIVPIEVDYDIENPYHAHETVRLYSIGG
jgi:hypothetical protein